MHEVRGTQHHHIEDLSECTIGERELTESPFSFESPRAQNDFLRIMQWVVSHNGSCIYTCEKRAPQSLAQIFPECRLTIARKAVYVLGRFGLLESAGKGVWAPTKLAYDTYRYLQRQGVQISDELSHKINGPHKF